MSDMDVDAADEKQHQHDRLSTIEIQRLLLSDAKVQDHVDALVSTRDRYLRQLRLFISRKVILTVSTNTKARILAACLIRRESEMANTLLFSPHFSVGEVARCILLLDAPRKARQARKKLTKLEQLKAKNPKRVKDKTLSRIRTTVHNLELEPHLGSFSGARQRLFRKWVQSIPGETLEFFLLNFPKDNWKIICDLVHTNPRDFACQYFQEAIFEEGKIPDDSIVAVGQKLTVENLTQLLQDYPYLSQCYSFIRRKLLNFTDREKAAEGKIEQLQMVLGCTRGEAALGLRMNNDNVEWAAEWIMENPAQLENVVETSRYDRIPAEAKHIIASQAPLEDVLWWYEELDTPEVEIEVEERLSSGQNPFQNTARSNYGKLMDRILKFRAGGKKFVPHLIPWAEQRLSEIHISKSEAFKVAVLGDASGSMDVAIRSSSIIASLLSVALDAELTFFHEEPFSPGVPTTARETVDIVERVKARGGTSMASALYPYYSTKKRIDLFILVSDEGENSPSHDMWFSEMFQKYQEEVSPQCQLFLVSFLSVGEEGLINRRLKDIGINCKQFRLHPEHPDTSKFDALLGMVALILSDMAEGFEIVMDCFRELIHKQEDLSVIEHVANLIFAFSGDRR